MRSQLSSAAWVPDDDPERPWGTAAALAIAWTERRCADEPAGAVLVTNALDHYGPELDAFGRRHAHTTRRAGRRRVGSGTGPVLSYVPYAEDLEFAMRLARTSSLAVVETVAFPVAGWARWLGAWDLVSDEETAPLPETVVDAVDRLRFYGNNGFGDDFGTRRALAILGDLRDQAQPLELVASAALAAGVSARGVARLERLVAKAA